MKYIDEFRDRELVKTLVNKIQSVSKNNIRLMEVCGGHTMAIRKFGIQFLLPETIELLSGPGCPVCVTERSFIDKAIAYAQNHDIIIVTYGDLMRVPGSESSLLEERAKGATVKTIYSTLEALDLAAKFPKKKIIFLGIGFETTTPSTAVAAIEAKKRKLQNFFIMSAHKIMPPAMSALIDEGIKINGYIGPGHVTTIAGAKIYQPLVDNFNISIAVSGFEPTDLLQSIYMLVIRLEKEQPGIDIQYSRAVTMEGNIKAQQIVNSVFELCNAEWRGLGVIPQSGLQLKKEYQQFDAEKQLPVKVESKPDQKGCICGEILKGKAKPMQCRLFRKACTPEYPIGACMVSSEGACNAYYRFENE